MNANGNWPVEAEIRSYRNWLRGLVMVLAPLNHNPQLFNVAWDIEYIPTVPNDKNRAIDGIDLRYKYVRETSNRLEIDNPCTMLEFLIGVAMRLNNIDYDPALPNRVGVWFWVLIENLDIVDGTIEDIEDAFYRINNRTYAFDGWGGLFPLRHPKEDQRSIEIWYQMQAYLIENF